MLLGLSQNNSITYQQDGYQTAPGWAAWNARQGNVHHVQQINCDFWHLYVPLQQLHQDVDIVIRPLGACELDHRAEHQHTQRLALLLGVRPPLPKAR